MVKADVDGDGWDDPAYHPWIASHHGPLLGVCTASGNFDEIEGGAMSELFDAGDLDGAGRDELLYDGTSVSQGFQNVAVFDGAKLRKVLMTTQKKHLVLENGPIYGDEGLLEEAVWGCEDVNSDGRTEVVQLTADWRGEGGRLNRKVFRLRGSEAEVVIDENSPAPPPERRLGEVAELIAPCSGGTGINGILGRGPSHLETRLARRRLQDLVGRSPV